MKKTLLLTVTAIFALNGFTQTWDEIVKAVASERAVYDLYGHSVSISGDRAVVSAPDEDEDAIGGNYVEDAGSVYVLELSGGVWTETAKLVASDRRVSDHFGRSVSISGDKIIVGAPSQDHDTLDANYLGSAGAAYIFELIGGVWVERAKLIASDRLDFAWFGCSVSISNDKAVVGAWRELRDTTSGNFLTNAGAAYTFELIGGVWTETAKLFASDRAEEDRFGSSVDISGDRVIVGAYAEDEDASGANTRTTAGSAYVYELIGGVWIETAKLVPSDREAGDVFGASVSMSGDRVIVGCEGESNSGAAYIFELIGGVWTETSKLMASDRKPYDEFGSSVSISGDKVVIGADTENQDDPGVPFIPGPGAAYIFELIGGIWTETAKIDASDKGPNELFGNNACISGDKVILGVTRKDTDASGGDTLNAAGAAYIYHNCNAPQPTGSNIQNFCDPATVADLSAIGANIQWYDTITGGSSLNNTAVLLDSTTYYATQMDSYGCESHTRLEVSVTYTTSFPTGDTSQVICGGGTLSDLTVSGSNIQWYDSAIGGNLLSDTDALADSVTYYASQTDNGCESQARLGITAIVSTSSPAGYVSQTFCGGSSVADLSVSGTDVQWYDAPSGGNLFNSTDALVDGTAYYASQTMNGCESESRLEVNVTVNDTPAPIGDANQPFCVGATVADLNVIGTNVDWYYGPVGGNPLNSSSLLVDGVSYYASQTVNGCESQTRLEVNISIDVVPTPTGDAAQTLCQGATVTDLTATGTNIQWYDAPSGGNLLNNTNALLDDWSYFATQTNSLGCESQSRLEVNVTLIETSAPTGNPIETFCGGTTVADLNAIGTNIQWYDVPTGGTPLSNNEALLDATTYFATQTINGCESQNRFDMSVNVNTISAPTGDANQTLCEGSTVADLNANGMNIQWYDAAAGGSLFNGTEELEDGVSYYASQTDFGWGCESQTRLEVTVNLGEIPAPTGDLNQSFCEGVTVADLIVSGTNIQWYDSPTGGNLLNSTDVLVDGSSYYASQSNSGCESLTRLEVNVILIETSAPFGDATQTFCGVATIEDLNATGTNIQWYDALNGGNLLNNTDALSDGTTYYASQSSNGCESQNRLEVNVTINTIPTNTVSVSGATFTADALVSGYQWLDCDGNYSIIFGETNQSFTATSNGNYAVELTENGCVDTSSCVVITTLGIIENEFGSELVVFPNPTDGNFTVDLGANYNSVKVSITGLNGKLIQTKEFSNSQFLNLTIEEPVGVYLLRIESDMSLAVIRLVKE